MASVSIMCKLSHVMSTVVTSNTFAALHISASSPVCEYTEGNQLYKCHNNCVQDYYTFGLSEADIQSTHILHFVS